jgi:transposase
MAAAEPATGRLHALVAGRVDARRFGSLLAASAAASPGERVILVLDNAGWHRARGLRVPPNAIRRFLPPHCPEANPVEQVWQWPRDHHTRGEPFRTRDARLDARCRGLVALMADPARVRSRTARLHARHNARICTPESVGGAADRGIDPLSGGERQCPLPPCRRTLATAPTSVCGITRWMCSAM